MTPHFISPLHCEKVSSGTWRLLSDLVFWTSLYRGGWPVIVPRGFITDFASVPRWPVTFLLAGDTAHEAAVVHDWLYTVHKIGVEGISRRLADDIFLEAIRASDPQAWGLLMWFGVRLGGSWRWDAPATPQERVSIAEMIAP